MAPIGLIVALPQLVLGSAVALLLYQKWVDARVVFASGLALIALACFSGMQLTADWNRDQFVVAQTLQAFGQPMAVVSMLFLVTSVVQPHEGAVRVRHDQHVARLRFAGRALPSSANSSLCAAASMRKCCWITRPCVGNSLPHPRSLPN